VRDGRPQLIPSDGRAQVRVPRVGEALSDTDVSSVAWSPSGRYLAYEEAHSGIRRIRLDGTGWTIVVESMYGDTGSNVAVDAAWQPLP
jgi:dipeptidyl aminopeptidase/acylaminoacyl peptidase